MDQLPRLGKRELICLLLFTCNYVVSDWRGFLFLWVLGMGYVILLWHSLSLPYNYSTKIISIFFLLYTNISRKKVHFTFSSYLSFLALSLDNEHESMLNATNKMFLIQFEFWCYEIIQCHKSSDFIGV